MAANLAGYILARHEAETSGVNNRESAAELIQWSRTEGANPHVGERLKLVIGSLYASFYDSWREQSAASIIFHNAGIVSFLCVFSLIPLTALLAVYKELEIGMMSGFAAGLNSAANGNISFFLAMPHLFLETPAILLTTALTVRSAIIVIGRRYGARIANRIAIAYGRWLEAAPILIFLFLAAGLIEGYLTPYLVQRLLTG